MSNKIEKNNKIVLGNRRLDTYKDHTLIDYVLRVIWREHKISRADVARKLGLSRSTVTEIVKDLLKTNFVKEVGSGDSSGGRKPVVLEFQDNAKFIIGLDIGATHISVILTNLRGKQLYWKEINHPVRTDPEGTWKLAIELCKGSIKEANFDSQNLMCIGVAFPSPIDPNHPEHLPEDIMPDWHGESGIENLLLHFNVPIFIDNDANLGALAEHWWGIGKGVDDIIYIKLGLGIGAGFILGGDIYRGSKGVAGEISHISINNNGRQCGCGLKGCLATYLTSWAIEERAFLLRKKYPTSSIDQEYPNIRMIEQAALDGDELAIRVVEETRDHLSVAITSLINLFNPSMIVIGGSLTRLGETLSRPIQDIINKTNLVSSVEPTKIKITNLGNKATAIGAATLALEEIFSEPNFINARKHVGSI